MADEKIKVETETGKTLEVVVVSRSADAIWVVLGEGVNNVRCKLTPTNNGRAYAGSVMGRELIYGQSVQEVRAAIAREQQVQFQFRPGPSGRRPR